MCSWIDISDWLFDYFFFGGGGMAAEGGRKCHGHKNRGGIRKENLLLCRVLCRQLVLREQHSPKPEFISSEAIDRDVMYTNGRTQSVAGEHVGYGKAIKPHADLTPAVIAEDPISAKRHYWCDTIQLNCRPPPCKLSRIAVHDGLMIQQCKCPHGLQWFAQLSFPAK